jgi:hypothetical protein
MKIPRFIISLTGTAILIVMLGCNDLGEQLAKVLPENGGPSIGNGQLSQSGDTNSIDPSEIGGGNSSMTPSMTDDSTEIRGFNDHAMDAGYLEIPNNVDSDMNLDMSSSDVINMGFGEDSQMMELSDLSEGLENEGFESDLGSQIGMFNLTGVPGNEGAFGVMESYVGDGAILEPPMAYYGGEQSLGGVGGGVGGLKKMANVRGPKKKMAAKGIGNSSSTGPSPKNGIRNFQDRPTKSTENDASGNSSNPQKPTMDPGNGKSTFKTNSSMVGIRMPGKVINPVYSLINTVAVPILLQNDTAMSFSSELLQQRDLTLQGTVYWVVHSQRFGFSRFAVPRVGGRVNGVVAKFTPTSGPFRAFIVAIEPNGQVTYLSSPVDIKWNP